MEGREEERKEGRLQRVCDINFLLIHAKKLVKVIV